MGTLSEMKTESEERASELAFLTKRVVCSKVQACERFWNIPGAADSAGRTNLTCAGLTLH